MESRVATKFRESVITHEAEHHALLAVERAILKDKAAHGAIVRPIAVSIKEAMEQLASVKEYRSVVGSVVGMCCDGTAPPGIPLLRGELTRPDVWLTTFALDDQSSDPSTMASMAVIVGIQHDRQDGRINAWVHLARGKELAAARLFRKRLSFFFEDGMIIGNPDEIADGVVSLLSELVAHSYVNNQIR